MLAGLAAALAAATASAAAAQTGCKLTPIGTATVAAARDGRTLMLADGRELRLAGIEATEASRGALQALVGAQLLRLERLDAGTGTEKDRYGRLVAFAFLPDAQQSVQQAMLEAGEARVSGRVGDRACAAALLAAEKAARTARRGLWADPNFAPLQAENPAGIEAKRGRFALVEGKVLSVRESGATLYVNFGRRWSESFTVIVPKRQQRTFAAAGVELKKLEGRRIRVRGFIERRGGPIIEAAVPEQIELVE
jgi:endonuclease YncB( thermonuclease family)